MSPNVKQDRQKFDQVVHNLAGDLESTGEPLTNSSQNLALNRPANQSSVSAWSHGKTPETAAAGGNNGNLTQEYGVHTGEENRPWWQVDLGREIVITSVVIYNRQKCAYRLRYFSLLGSLDGKDWQRFYRRASAQTFGEAVDDKLVVVLEHIVIARFVRLKLDYRETLNFRECEVYGRSPTQGDYREFALQDDVIARKRALTAGRTGFIQKIGDHAVFVDEINYAPKIVKALQNSRYEREERLLTQHMLLPSDRVLEVGMGIGVVTMIAADATAPEQVCSFDGNPYIVADAKRNFAFNQMPGIKAAAGVLKNRRNLKHSEKTTKFTVFKDFWASRIGAGPPAPYVLAVVDVPIVCLEDEIAAHRANVLIVDIEGGEIDLLSRANLSRIRLIVMETHYWAAGAEATDKMIRRLIHQGFDIDVSISRFGVVVLRRDLDRRRKAILRMLSLPSKALRRALAQIRRPPDHPVSTVEPGEKSADL